MISVCISVLYIFIVHIFGEPLIDLFFLKQYHKFHRITRVNPSGNMKLHKNLLYTLAPCILCGGRAILCGGMMLLFIEVSVFFRAYRNYKKEISMLLYEFPMWLRELQCLLAYNTVYQAIKTSYEIAPKSLRYSINELVKGIEMHPSSIAPYHAFLKEYDSLEVRRVMKVLHRVGIAGTDDATTRLNAMIAESHHWLMFSRNQKKEMKITQISAMGLVPLVGVGIIFLLLMGLVVVSLMEGG